MKPERQQERFIVAYGEIDGDGLHVSPPFDSYEDALAFTGSEEGAGEAKAIIIRAGVDCRAEVLHVDTEDHT